LDHLVKTHKKSNPSQFGSKMDLIYEKRPWLKNYPAQVPPDLRVGSQTALNDFIISATRRPDAPAVLYFDHIISYGEIERLSNKLAAALSDIGLGKGDRMIVNLQNVPQFLITVYAAWKLGAIAVPLNPMYKEMELAYFCRDSGAKVFLTHDDIAAGLDLSFLKETAVCKVITTSPLDLWPAGKELPGMLKQKTKITVPGTQDMLALMEGYKDKDINLAGVSPGDVAYLTYTSGTTGAPKGAMNTHGNLAFNARVYKAMQRIDETDVVLGVAPLFHVTGEVAHLAIAALAGIPVVLYYRFDAGETLRLIERWKVTMSVASITVYIALMNHPDIKTRDLSSFVKAYSGGAPVSESIVDQFQKLTGLYLYNVYGMTETNSPSHIVPWGKRAPVDRDSGALSVGVPVSNCIMKIMDLENGSKALAPGEVGEIVDSGPIIVPGYWQKPEETRHAIRNGWLYTGDVGKMDEDGWFYVVDRKKDMIVAHPAVKEVAVIGVPDSYRGETVKAFVTPKQGLEDSISAEEVISFCKARMAAYKYPRQVEIVSEIPKTLTGKFLKRELRQK
jgi:long-chain acyl-CoA synthetase